MYAFLAFFVASGSVAEAPRRIAFTFDDGPSYKTTPALLEELDQWGVRATFFVNGSRFAGDSQTGRLNREVLRMVHDRGHAVGNHTYQHLPLRTLAPAQQREEVIKNEELLIKTLGERPTLFRPPYGRQSSSSWRLVHQRGYRVVLWDVSPLDHFLHNAAALRDRVMEEIRRKGGGVVILHDTYPWTVEAFGLIMKELKKENCRMVAAGDTPYQVVPLEEILEPRASPRRREEWLAGLGPTCAVAAASESAPTEPVISPAAESAQAPGRPWTDRSGAPPSPTPSPPASSAARTAPPSGAAPAALAPR